MHMVTSSFLFLAVGHLVVRGSFSRQVLGWDEDRARRQGVFLLGAPWWVGGWSGWPML